jgi:predicted nucleotidyltransferase
VNVIRDEVIRCLLGLGVSPSLLDDLPHLSGEIEGVLIYGSQARGDAVPGSDLDMLALVADSRSSTYSGNVNVSYYTNQQLSTGIGTLFGAHLKRDAKVIWDKHGNLARAVEGMGEINADRLLSRAWSLTELFTSPGRDLPKYLLGLLREARYLLRSCLYAQAIASGNPCFSVRELAIRLADPHLARLLASRQPGEATIEDLEDCLLRLAGIVGEFPSSQHGSLEATIVNEWGRPSDLLSMAFMALGATGNGSDYAEVEKILL